MILLNWRQTEPAIITRWRGPDGRIAAVIAVNPPSPVPTLIGPPGVAGPIGPEGPVAELIDGGTFN
jgi:hypothetical protein